MISSFENISPSIFNAYNICKRQAWLMSRQLNADQNDNNLKIGKLIDNSSFKREKKNVYIENISARIDIVTKKDGKVFISEIKKSSKSLNSGKLQLKYYLYLLHKKGIKVGGLIKIPREKKSIEVNLIKKDINGIEKIIKDAKQVLENNSPPVITKTRLCKTCAHYEFCWS